MSSNTRAAVCGHESARCAAFRATHGPRPKARRSLCCSRRLTPWLWNGCGTAGGRRWGPRRPRRHRRARRAWRRRALLAWLSGAACSMLPSGRPIPPHEGQAGFFVVPVPRPLHNMPGERRARTRCIGSLVSWMWGREAHTTQLGIYAKQSAFDRQTWQHQTSSCSPFTANSHHSSAALQSSLPYIKLAASGDVCSRHVHASCGRARGLWPQSVGRLHVVPVVRRSLWACCHPAPARPPLREGIPCEDSADRGMGLVV